MQNLNLPPFAARIKDNVTQQKQIFDQLRRKYVALTPEEWVRQSFVHYLIAQKGYPSSLLANEVALTIGEKTLRADTVLFDTAMRARMIVEYKAPSVPINKKVLEQAAAYNSLLHVDYLVVSNGMTHYCCKVDYTAKRCVFLDDIPSYAAL